MNEFEQCVKRRGLVSFDSAGRDAVLREMQSAHQDLADVDLMLQHAQWKRVTITAYYVMFHAARALTIDRGYAEKSHFCLGVAFRHFFGDTSEGRELASGLERARVLREDADYRAEFDETGANAAAKMARRFLDFADEQIKSDG